MTDNTKYSAGEERSGSISESESKAVLKPYGIPVVREIAASGKIEATQAAREIGFPVVVKGLGTLITHKTERNLAHRHHLYPH